MKNGLLLLFLLLVMACATAIHQQAVGYVDLSKRQPLPSPANIEENLLLVEVALDIRQKAYTYAPDEPHRRCAHGACYTPIGSGDTLTAALPIALHVED